MSDNRLYSWQQAITRSDLAWPTRHLLLTLSLAMDDQGEDASVSTKQLAHLTGLSERCVVTHLGRAKAAGFLSSRLRGLSGQRWKRMEYRAEIPETSKGRTAA